MKKLIKLALLILFLLSFAYPANAATIDLVRSTVEYTDNVDQGGILEFLWNTPGLNNEEVRYLIGDIPSEFDVSEANVQISSNMGTFDKAIRSYKIALKSTTTLNGNLEVKIGIPIPSGCPENTYTLEISEMVGSDSDMLSPSSIDITVQKSSTKTSTPTLNDPGTTDTDGSYTISWSSVSGATSYTLEEDTSSSFSSPTVVHSGAGTSKYITGKSDDTYYYRVKACNAGGCSGWSNVEDINVEILGGNILFQDNFDNYLAGTFPSSGGWQLIYSGYGNSHQVVDNSQYVSSPNSFKLEGRANWAANAYHPLNQTPDLVSYEADVMVTQPESSVMNYDDAALALSNPNIGTWGTYYGQVTFDRAENRVIQPGNIPYNFGVWYHIKVTVDMKKRVYDVWVDDQLVASNIPTSSNGDYTGFRVEAGNNAHTKVWFDNIKVEASGEDLITVDDSGGADYTHIQEAVNNARSGSTIRVSPGTYKENVDIDKPLKLIGEDKSTTIIDGGGNFSCVFITADNVEVRGFTLKAAFWGINLNNSNNNIITDNNITMNYFSGISLYSSNNNLISDNDINVSKSGLSGIILHDSNSNTISNNILTGSPHFFSMGIFLLHSSSNNLISDNDISENGCGMGLNNSNNNLVYSNNFINNAINVYSTGSTNIWNSPEEKTYVYNGNTYTNHLGNYWDDYKEKYPDAEEIDSTGIWDTAYSIDLDKDNYPLMEPWEEYFAVSQPNLKITITSDKEEYSPGDTVNITTAFEVHATPEEPVIITNPITVTFIAPDGSVVLQEDLDITVHITLWGGKYSIGYSFKLSEDAPEGYCDVTVSFSGGKYVKTAENLFYVKAESTDTTPPVIISVEQSNDFPGQGEDVTITAHVTDNIGVTSVTLGYDTTELAMTLDSGSEKDEYWSATIPGQPACTTLSISVTASDAAGNTATFGPHEKHWVDAIAPTISNIKVSQTYALPGDSINISAKVFDYSGVKWVRAYINKDGELVTTVFMSDPDEDGIYAGTWQTMNFTESGIYNIGISAIDTVGNEVLVLKAADVEIT